MKLQEWASKKLFQYVHSNKLIYNQCWEDPRLDIEAMELKSTDRILMIASAGCNALEYALQGPRKITAVDMNPWQIALLELKIAAIRGLDYDDFFKIFGEGRHPAFKDLYFSKIRGNLKAYDRLHWDKHLDYFSGSRLRRSFYYRGASGYFAWLLNHYFDMKKVRGALKEAFEAQSLDEQSKIYEEAVSGVLWTKTLNWALRRDATLSLLGVPRDQKLQVEKDVPGGIAAFMKDCVDTVFTRLPLRDNYFWWLYFNGAYSANRCPNYMLEANFHRLKSGLVDSIETQTTSILEYCRQAKEPVTRFVLLDHMDWLSANAHQTLVEEWQAMLDLRAKDDCRFLWRSGGFRSDFIDEIKVKDERGQGCQVSDLLHYQREKAARLHARDRVHTYGSFYVAHC